MKLSEFYLIPLENKKDLKLFHFPRLNKTLMSKKKFFISIFPPKETIYLTALMSAIFYLTPETSS